MKNEALTSKPAQELLPVSDHVAQLEATFLRLPFFAIGRKTRKEVSVIAIEGRQEGREYTIRISKNADTPYPGQLSRRVHFALMALLTEQCRPWSNPICFSWYELCKRMGIAKSGRSIADCKAAIDATHGAVIRTAGLLRDDRGGYLSAQVKLHLYEKVVFAEWREREGGRVCDENQVWLGGWYLERLAENQRRVNVPLWQQLEQRSSIASRLYELLLYYGEEVPEINYTTLAHLIPVKPEQKRSTAHRQMEQALNLVRMANIIKDYRWAASRSDRFGKLILTRGERTRPGAAAGLLPVFCGEESIVTREVELTPEQVLVEKFYEQWLGAGVQANAADLELAGKLIRENGAEHAERIVHNVIPILKAHWPQARTFCALDKYVPDAIKAETAAKTREARKHQAGEEAQRRREERQQQKVQTEEINRAWKGLTEEERERIREEYSRKNPLIAGRDVFIVRLWYNDHRGGQG